MFETIVKEANDIVIVAEIDPQAGTGFRINYTNAAFSRVFGYSAEEARGRSPRMLQGPDTCPDTIREISRVVHQGASIRRRILNYSKDGQKVWVDVNIVPLPSSDSAGRRFAAIERDVSGDVSRERELEDLAFGDPLTKLANRRYFDQALSRELARASRSGIPVSLAILDIDHFKAVNDTWGHPAGDGVLVSVARAIMRVVRNYDHVARIGGEEFAILLPGAEGSDALAVTERVCAEIRATPQTVTRERTISVTCSAGVASLNGWQASSDQLIQRADQALYRAKNMGRNCVKVALPQVASVPQRQTPRGANLRGVSTVDPASGEFVYNSLLRELYEHWKTLPCNERGPLKSSFNPLNLSTAVWPRLFMIDIPQGHSDCFVRLVGPYLVAALGRDFTGCKLDEEEMPGIDTSITKALLERLNEDSEPQHYLGPPTFQFSDRFATHEQIMLPLLDQSGRIAAVIGAIDYAGFAGARC